MRVLITAGPTREYIDDIRFISNASSGLMGLALAEEAVNRGFDVCIVLGPTHHKPFYGVKVLPVVSSAEMIDRSLKELENGYDLLISAAAIGDFTPTKKVHGKISSKEALTIELVPTKKLIQEARLANSDLKIVAFKAEYGMEDDELEDAGRSLLEWADLVVANDVKSGVFGSESTDAVLISDGIEEVGRRTKSEAAEIIFDRIMSDLFFSDVG
jgi:phosphopantothenoylcysteine decarboxylase/phosphopantothenate--cysteine ligase